MKQLLPDENKIKQYTGCASCALSDLCEAAESKQGHLLEVPIHHSFYMVENKQSLANSDDKDRAFYALCSGSFKTISHNHNSRHRIVDLHLPGDVLRLESYLRLPSRTNLIANERSIVSEFVLPEYTNIKSATFLQELLAISAQQISDSHEKNEIFHGKKNTLELVTSFILFLSRHHRKMGVMISDFKLPMIRSEIAEYLSLAPETIGRQLIKLKNLGLIEINGQRLTILDHSALEEISGARKEEG